LKITSYLYLGIILTVLFISPVSTALPDDLDDSDVILLLPAHDTAQETSLLAETEDWITAREGAGYTIAVVPLYSIIDYYGLPAESALTAEEIRLYLRTHFTDRSSGDSVKGRYLMIFSRQEEITDGDYPLIPRYELNTDSDTVSTDSPYGFIGQETIDGGDGIVNIPDLDFSDPTLLVTRIPLTYTGELEDFLQRALNYEAVDYSRDLTLVAGRFAMDGDSAYIQSLNAGLVNDPSLRVFDTTQFSPDYICTGPGQRFSTFMESSAFSGGVVYNISHGSNTAIYAYYNNLSFANLSVTDLSGLSSDKLNIFISLACANDSDENGLARNLFDHSSAAVISATKSVNPIDPNYIMAGETTFLPNFFNQPNSLMQAAQQTRHDYYLICAEDPEDEDNQIAFVNILAFNIYGDGLITLPFPSPTPSSTPAVTVTASPTPTLIPEITVPPTPTPPPSPVQTIPPTPDPTSSSSATPVPDPTIIPSPPTPTPGRGDSRIGIYRGSTGLWALRGSTRLYFGGSKDIPVDKDYNGDGTREIALFRSATGLWAIRGISRFYFGTAGDSPVPADYNGDGSTEAAIFRDQTGLWAARTVTRLYFGSSDDRALPGDYNGNGTDEAGIFRAASGLWAIRGMSRIYFGGTGDTPIPGDYDGDRLQEIGIYRPFSGLWAIRGVTRTYFGTASDQPLPSDYDGSGTSSIGIFREDTGLWAIKGFSRVYFGSSGDIPVTR